MTFWDSVPDTPGLASFDDLVSQTPPDIEKILGHPDVLSSFLVPQSPLQRVLAIPANTQKVIQIIFTHANVKLAKKAVELYVAKGSPLLLQIVENVKLGELFIQKIEGSDAVRTGFVSRVFQTALINLRAQTVSFFQKSSESLVILTKSVNVPAVGDLLEAYVLQLAVEERWYIFAVLKIIGGSGVVIPSSFAGAEARITQVSSQVQASALTVAHKCGLLKLVKTGITDCQVADLQSAVTQAIPVIFKAHQEESVRVLALKLGTVLPRHKEVIKIAAEVAKRPLPWSELSLTGLDLLSVDPNSSYRGLCATLIERFVADQSNSIFHVKFIRFVKASIEVPELRQRFVEGLPPVILKGAQPQSWRKSAAKAGVLMELAIIIDPYITSATAEWAAFRASAIGKWETRNAEAHKEWVPTASNPIVDEGLPAPRKSAESAPPRTVPTAKAAASDGFGDFGQFPTIEPEKKQEDTGFGEFPTFDEPKTGDSGFGSFPQFGQPQEEAIGFGDFPKFEESKPDSPGFGGFPKFEQPKTDDGSAGFGFPTFEDAKPDSAVFPAFEEVKMDTTDSGFGGSAAFVGDLVRPETVPVSVPKPASSEPIDLSFEHFLELINHPCWDYTGPSPAELFGQKDRFSTVDEAFEFLVSQA
jgi:hypothetical protein